MPLNQEKRKDLIVDTLKTDPKTMPELARQLHMNYFTLRNDVKQLETEGRVFNTAVPRNGALLYSAGQVSNELSLIKISKGRQLSGTDLLTAWAKAKFAAPNNVVNASRAVLFAIMELYNKAESIREQNREITENEFSEIVRTLNAARVELNDAASYITQLLSAKVWSTEDLRLLQYDQGLVQEIQNAYGDFVNNSQTQN